MRHLTTRSSVGLGVDCASLHLAADDYTEIIAFRSQMMWIQAASEITAEIDIKKTVTSLTEAPVVYLSRAATWRVTLSLSIKIERASRRRVTLRKSVSRPLIVGSQCFRFGGWLAQPMTIATQGHELSSSHQLMSTRPIHY